MRISDFCTERVERWLEARDGCFLVLVGDEVDMTPGVVGGFLGAMCGLGGVGTGGQLHRRLRGSDGGAVRI